MRFLADENIDRPIVEKLRSRNFDISYIEEEAKGAEDTKVLEKAIEENRVLITFDRDFNRPGKEHPGIIRITKPARYELIANMVEELAEIFSKKDFQNTVVESSPSNFQ